ncbi:MAG: glycerophosphodiester phosphodiesterase [Candidatus Njordarchaeales archaeon]
MIDEKRKPWCIAHRGASKLAPENTLKSFKKAIELGADMIELDVRLTKDRKVVVIHDADISRTSNGSGPVRSYTLEELRKFDFGDGERIPTLEEALELARDKVLVNVEIKEPDMVREVVEVIKKTGMVNQVIVSSFIHPILPMIKKLEPSIKTAILFVCYPVNVVRLARDAMADFINPYHEAVEEMMVNAARSAGLGILPWTVDDEESMKKLIRLGVDGVITNDPALFLRVRKEILGF